MPTLLERVASSAADCPRSPYDLLRYVALFVPEDHPLAQRVHNILDMWPFTPPEDHWWRIAQVTGAFEHHYPHKSICAAPEWVKICCDLLRFGADGPVVPEETSDAPTDDDRLIRDLRLLDNMFPYETIVPECWSRSTEGTMEYAIAYYDNSGNPYFFHAYVEEDGTARLRPVAGISCAVECMDSAFAIPEHVIKSALC